MKMCWTNEWTQLPHTVSKERSMPMNRGVSRDEILAEKTNKQADVFVDVDYMILCNLLRLALWPLAG